MAALAAFAALVLALAPGLVPIARAHLGHIVVGAERYLKVDVAAAEARIVVSLTLGPSEGRRVLEAADSDHDGTVTSAEADRYLADWVNGLVTDMPIRLDGDRARVRWVEPFLDPVGPVGDQPLSVEMVAHVALSRGRHTLTISDRMRNDAIDRTDVAFRARDGAELRASGIGSAPTRVVTDLAFAGARRGDLTAVVVVPGATAGSRPAAPASTRSTSLLSLLWLAIPIAAALITAIALIAKRRRAG